MDRNWAWAKRTSAREQQVISGKTEGARGREVEKYLSSKNKKERLFRGYTLLGIRMQDAFLWYQDARTVHSLRPRSSSEKHRHFSSETKYTAGSYLTPVFISYPTSDLTGNPIGFYLQNTPRTSPGRISLPHTWAWLVSTSTVSPLGVVRRLLAELLVSTLAVYSLICQPEQHLLRPIERGGLQSHLQGSGSGPSDSFTYSLFFFF